ncbi:unnamed protein product [Paramecium pentaurelia]|uniref:H-type lectin domain-containing protein n=1 Tax=Paramecium pentaurelia TaxID=43138 RepID=A0A8S1X5L8_9CILI|nr:unnamed protein product [Paramecium pentaurelia]
MLIIQFVLCIFSADADHLFEQGVIQHFNYVSNPNLILHFSSAKFRQEEVFIPFSKQFSQAPDVYLNVKQIDLAYTFPQGYTLDITSISTLGFKVKMVCESPELFFGVIFNWFAFNDDSVQVISNLNITYPNSQYTHSYMKNCKIDVALSNLVSFYAEGPQFNNVTVYNQIIQGLSLTTDTVTISFYTYNVKQIGYQILLTSSDLFLIGPTITNISPYGSSQIVNFPQGWETQNCFSNLLGFKHDGTDHNIRLDQRILYSPNIIVGFYPWHETIIQSIQHNYFCINDAYFDLAIFDGLMQTQFFDKTNQIETHIEILEINYNQNQNVGEEITIPQCIQSLKIIYYWKCIGYEQLKLQLFCTEVWCSSSKVQCNVDKTNIVRLSASFLFITASEQYIQITKSSASLTATQIIKQQNPFQKVLFKVEMVT